MKKVLVLAPHTDDGELGCGATLSKLIRNGAEIHYVAFSACEESVSPELPSNILRIELMNAMDILGVDKEKVKIFNFKVRNFISDRQKILDTMIELNREIKPDLVFMPSCNDVHQDHRIIAEEGLRAFKHKSILCYEVPWNNYTFNNQAFSVIEEYDLEQKICAIDCYKSQKKRPYAQKEYIKALLLAHGVQCGAEYAEVFEIPRWII